MFNKILYRPNDNGYEGYYFYNGDKADELVFSFKIDNCQLCCEDFGINLYKDGIIYHGDKDYAKDEIVWLQTSQPVTAVRWAYPKDLPPAVAVDYAGIVIEFDDKTRMSVVAYNNRAGDYQHNVVFTLDGKEDKQRL